MVDTQVRELEDLVTMMRRELHQIPELGLEEQQTAAYIRNKLVEFGVTETYEVLGTGTIAVLRGAKAGKTLAFRSDIDALPVAEETGYAFASKTPGKMHACGHDGHMATLLGFIAYLHRHPERIQGTLVFVFQPAEEGPGGAELIMQTGILQKLGVEEIVGLHVFPDLPAGKISCRPGAMMARNAEVTITIKGVSSHGAQPQLGEDAIVAAGGVISGLNSILARNIGPLDNVVLTFGTIYGGEAMNIVAKEVVLHGTMRAFDDAVYDEVVRRVELLASEIAKGYGCEAEVDFNHMYRVVDNDPQMVAVLEKVAADYYVETPPYLIAEDFSWYQQEIPGVFFFLGIRDEEKGYTYPLHSSKLKFDEVNLLLGIQTYVNLIVGLNGE
ncbi:M20 family metallopeptidase [Enterococcus pseudoavium]|uniref:M20 family metallopeptidase n=1 Tax=Enterococcus pseudoavium TaxID=44007 RepID=A0ABU3FEN0_9ENTE|nr:M20 family metallopeptidase [Enterococcus pseudoavium]MDT2754451.1 M20 family metallopeptidase [Enterococcus pseudoavium]MDT2769493.1 M20 family metallopeptidase [Enterococcus pseudoavium]